MDLVIIGGGFAGVWAAAAAARLRDTNSASDLDITVVTPGDDLVIRPRLYEADPARASVPLERILGPIDVRHVRAAVTGIDAPHHRVVAVTAAGERLDVAFDQLVLASGSRLVMPSLPGSRYLYNVDTIGAATRLEAHLRALPDRPPTAGRFTAVVVGAGFSGLEVATELAQRLHPIADACGEAEQIRVVLVERDTVVAPDLGPGPRPVIEHALAELGIETRLGVTLRAIDAQRAILSDASVIRACTVIWTAGMRADSLTAALDAPRDHLGRLEVDSYLRVAGVPDVLAAGDTAAAFADDSHVVMQSCQHALQTGRYAGHNAAADLLGLAPLPFEAAPYVTCLDLGPAGAVYTTGWHREVRLTGEAAKQRKSRIIAGIYPPVDDPAELLRRAALPYVRPAELPPPTVAA